MAEAEVSDLQQAGGQLIATFVTEPALTRQPKTASRASVPVPTLSLLFYPVALALASHPLRSCRLCCMFLFEWQRVAMALLAIFGVVMLAEIAVVNIRKRLI
jgi:hypothetical protein